MMEVIYMNVDSANVKMCECIDQEDLSVIFDPKS